MHFRVDSDGRRQPRPIAEINRLRRDLGMVFQQFNLWPAQRRRQRRRGAAPRARQAQRGDRARARMPAARPSPRQGRGVPGAALRRAAAARGDRPRAGDAAQGDAVRRPPPRSDPELTDEVLAVMRDLARDGTTMIVVRTRCALRARCRTACFSCITASSRKRVRPRRCSARPGRSAAGSSSQVPAEAPTLGAALSAALREALNLSVFWEYREVLLKGLAFNYVFACAAAVALTLSLGGVAARRPLASPTLAGRSTSRSSATPPTTSWWSGSTSCCRCCSAC